MAGQKIKSKQLNYNTEGIKIQYFLCIFIHLPPSDRQKVCITACMNGDDRKIQNILLTKKQRIYISDRRVSPPLHCP